MNSQTLKFLALLMVIGSVILAIVALRIGGAPENPPAATQAEPPKQPAPRIVVAARAIRPGDEIRDADLELASVDPAPPDAFRNTEEVVGRYSVAAIGAGNPVLQSHFPAVNPLTGTLREDERAVAVKVNNLIGVGGFLRPGDKVDVLLYLRGNDQPDKKNRSLVVVPSVRVLAYGDELASAEDAGKKEKIKSKDAGTAVLAVSARDAVRLNLAENAGVLRLTLRPALAAETGAEDPGSMSLNEIVAAEPEKNAAKEPKGPVVEVYRAGQKSIIQFP
ncbi:Flp pilus assembly protein CpaB [Methylocaldum sp. MU1018]